MKKLNIIKKLMARYMWLSGRASYSMIAERLGAHPAIVSEYLKGVGQREEITYWREMSEEME